MDTGTPAQSPGETATLPEQRLTAKQVGELLNPSRGKRRILQWANEHQPAEDRLPFEWGSHRGQKSQMFLLSEVQAWAARHGFAGGQLLQDAAEGSKDVTPAASPAVVEPARSSPSPVTMAAVAGVDELDLIEAKLKEHFSYLLDRKPREIGGQVVVDPAADQKAANALKNLLSEWRLLREQRHEERIRNRKVLDRNKAEGMLTSLCEIMVAAVETYQIEVARVAVSVATDPANKVADRQVIDRTVRAMLKPFGDAMRRRIADHAERQVASIKGAHKS